MKNLITICAVVTMILAVSGVANAAIQVDFTRIYIANIYADDEGTDEDTRRSRREVSPNDAPRRTKMSMWSNGTAGKMGCGHGGVLIDFLALGASILLAGFFKFEIALIALLIALALIGVLILKKGSRKEAFRLKPGDQKAPSPMQV